MTVHLSDTYTFLQRFSGKLNPSDFKFLRDAATNLSLNQRLERDQAREARQQQTREEAGWVI